MNNEQFDKTLRELQRLTGLTIVEMAVVLKKYNVIGGHVSLKAWFRKRHERCARRPDKKKMIVVCDALLQDMYDRMSKVTDIKQKIKNIYE